MGKLIEERANSAEFVASAVDTHADILQARFEDRFAAHIHRGEQPDIAVVLRVIARALRANARDMSEASDAHDRELADDAAPRAERDRATALLVSELSGLRAAVDTVHGPALVARIGFDGRTPTDAKSALALARKLQSAVADPKFHWPKSARKGLRLDPDEWMESIASHAKDVDAALKDLTREAREAEVTVTARDAKVDAHDALFGNAASMISAAMKLLGEPDLASRVRPSTRRPGTVEADPGESPAQNQDNPSPTA